MSQNPFNSMDQMEMDNPDIGGHTEGDPGRPFIEQQFDTLDDESVTVNTNVRSPEYDEENGHHFNAVSNINGEHGFNNTHIGVDEQDY